MTGRKKGVDGKVKHKDSLYILVVLDKMHSFPYTV